MPKKLKHAYTHAVLCEKFPAAIKVSVVFSERPKAMCRDCLAGIVAEFKAALREAVAKHKKNRAKRSPA